MRLLICGDRNWNNLSIIYTSVCNLLRIQWANGEIIDQIIEGGAWGADYLARQVAIKLSLEYLTYPANWEKFGKAAGPIRNKVMLHRGKPDLVLAFHNDISSSKGTKHMITIARESGVPVWLINSKNEWTVWL